MATFGSILTRRDSLLRNAARLCFVLTAGLCARAVPIQAQYSGMVINRTPQPCRDRPPSRASDRCIEVKWLASGGDLKLAGERTPLPLQILVHYPKLEVAVGDDLSKWITRQLPATPLEFNPLDRLVPQAPPKGLPKKLVSRYPKIRKELIASIQTVLARIELVEPAAYDPALEGAKLLLGFAYKPSETKNTGRAQLLIPVDATRKQMEQAIQDSMAYLVERKLAEYPDGRAIKTALKIPSQLDQIALDCTHAQKAARDFCVEDDTQDPPKYLTLAVLRSWQLQYAKAEIASGIGAQYGCVGISLGDRPAGKFVSQKTDSQLGETAEFRVLQKRDPSWTCDEVGDEAGVNCVDDNHNKQGLWKTECYENGVCSSEGSYVSDLAEGIWKECTANGVCNKGRYVAGVREGTWQNCYTESKCVDWYYKNGRLEGTMMMCEYEGFNCVLKTCVANACE